MNTYVGEWKDDKKNGQGTYTWPNGEKYVGDYKDGLMNGRGTWTFPDGKQYVGEFKDGKLDGRGTWTFPDGTKYVGEFKDGKLDGRGTWTFPDGTKRVGEYRDGEFRTGSTVAQRRYLRQIDRGQALANELAGVATCTPPTPWQLRPMSGLSAEQKQGAWWLALDIAGGRQPTRDQVAYASWHVRLHGLAEPKPSRLASIRRMLLGR